MYCLPCDYEEEVLATFWPGLLSMYYQAETAILAGYVEDPSFLSFISQVSEDWVPWLNQVPPYLHHLWVLLWVHNVSCMKYLLDWIRFETVLEIYLSIYCVLNAWYSGFTYSYFYNLQLRQNMYLIFKILHKFPLAPMGVLAPVSAHARPSAQPPIWEGGQKNWKIFGQFFRHFRRF